MCHENVEGEAAETLSLYNELMKPVMTDNISAGINEKTYEAFMKHIEERTAALTDEQITEVAKLCLKYKSTWNDINEVYENYVNVLTNIQIVDDAEGQITCNVPGAKYTFKTNMKEVDYAQAFKTFNDNCLAADWEYRTTHTDWGHEYLTPIDHSHQLSGDANWMYLFKGARFGNTNSELMLKNEAPALSKEVYQKIYKFYETRGLCVMNTRPSYVTITEGRDENGNDITYRTAVRENGTSVPLSLQAILMFDAGMTTGNGKIAVPNGNTGFKLEKTGTGEWNIAYVWVADCKVEYFNIFDTEFTSNDQTVLAGYACGNSDSAVSYMYRPSYYNSTYSAVRDGSFVMLDAVRAN